MQYTVDHDILLVDVLSMLFMQFGIEGVTLSWLEYYLLFCKFKANVGLDCFLPKNVDVLYPFAGHVWG